MSVQVPKQTQQTCRDFFNVIPRTLRERLHDVIPKHFPREQILLVSMDASVRF